MCAPLRTLPQAVKVKMLANKSKWTWCIPFIKSVQSSDWPLVITSELSRFRNQRRFSLRKPLRVLFVATWDRLKCSCHSLVKRVRTLPPKVRRTIRAWRTPVLLFDCHPHCTSWFQVPALSPWVVLVPYVLSPISSNHAALLSPLPSLSHKSSNIHLHPQYDICCVERSIVLFIPIQQFPCIRVDPAGVDLELLVKNCRFFLLLTPRKSSFSAFSGLPFVFPRS